MPSFVCKRCKKEFDCIEEGITLCWICFKILSRQYERTQQLRDKSMLWSYHNNTIPVDRNTISPLDEHIVLSE
jgi:hypothetical protein